MSLTREVIIVRIEPESRVSMSQLDFTRLEDRLDNQRAEIERLTRENEMLRKGWPDFTKLQADLAACRAELQALKEAL